MKASAISNAADDVNKGRNVIVCCDGTGIGQDNVKAEGELTRGSNVVRIYNCIDTTSTDCERPQIVYYERGVGSVGNVLTKMGRGLTGMGINAKIRIMYQWLGEHWKEYDNNDEEDRLFLFGFSRGAFAICSLMGMIHHVGLLDLKDLDPQESQRRVEIAFNSGYRNRLPRNDWAVDADETPWPFFGRIPFHFVGPFDVVGQLGMPREHWALWALGFLCCFTPKSIGFHDVEVNEDVRTLRHAIAIDEMRSTFQPVGSRNASPEYLEMIMRKDIKQVWFPGGHGNIGGGLFDTGLSDGALMWMIEEASAKGLQFHQRMLEQIKPNYQANIFLKHTVGVYSNLTFYPRSVPAIVPENSHENEELIESVHISAIQRSADPSIDQAPYWSTTILKLREELTTVVDASQVYNTPYLFLEEGATYEMTSKGVWSCFPNQSCGPDGYESSALARHPYSCCLLCSKSFQNCWRKATGNAETRLPNTSRHPQFPLLSVIGMIAIGGVRNAKAEAEFHEVFLIGSHSTHQVTRSGYLYCYANDNWNDYSTNKGTLELTVKRIK